MANLFTSTLDLVEKFDQLWILINEITPGSNPGLTENFGQLWLNFV